MADAEALRTAVLALLPPQSKAIGTGQGSGASLPWTRVSISMPSPQSRRMSKRVANQRMIARLVVAGANEIAAWRVAQFAIAALEGARPVAAGWECGPLEQLNREPIPYEDRDLKVIDTNAFVVCIPLDFDFYATSKETP